MESLVNASNGEMVYNDSFTRNNTAMSHEPPISMVLSATLLYIVIFFVGIIGNILVMTVIIMSSSMKTTVNMYLMNLCLADVLVILVCMPTALADMYTKEVWYFGSFMCRFVPFLENVVASASVLTILAISIERYRVVRYPLKAVQEEKVTVGMLILIVWIVAVCSSIPWLFIAIIRDSTLLDGTPIKVCRNPITEPWQKIYIVIIACIFFLFPCFILFMLNCHLCRVLGQKSEIDVCTSEGRDERRAKKKQVANVIASIVSIFFLCHLPFRIAGLWFTFADVHDIASLGLEGYFGVVYSIRILFYLNHALNPVVYNFVSTKFRKALMQILPGNGYHRKRGFSHVSSGRVLLPRHIDRAFSSGTHARDCRQDIELTNIEQI